MMYNVNTYDKSGDRYKVFVNDSEVHVFDTQVLFDGIDETRMIYHPYISSYSVLSVTEPSRVTVYAQDYNINKVKIQPETHNVKYTADGQAISFVISPGENLCITINDDINRMLMLFANKKEEYIPKSNDIYFGAGTHKSDIYLKSGQRLYIDEGAIVYGRIYANDCSDIEIAGEGILCGSYNNGRWAEWLREMVDYDDGMPRRRLCQLDNCKNIKISNVTFVDSDEWTMCLSNCDNACIDGVRILGYQSNSDGIDICSSRNVEISNIFIRTSDDCVVIKSSDLGEASNVNVSRCTLWADRASAIEIGHEVCSDIHNIRFTDIDILNQVETTYGYHAIDICNADGADVYDVVYDNIRIEDCVRNIGLRIREGRFSDEKTDRNGEVKDIKFRNIYCGRNRAFVISGRNEDKRIKNVSFENILIEGEKVKKLDFIMRNKFFENIALYEDGQKKDLLEDYPKADSMIPLSITEMYNHILGDDRGIYGVRHEDWITMPSGRQVMEGIPFDIAGQGKTKNGDYKRVVIPPDRIGLSFKAKATTDINAKWLFLLHTGVNILSDADKVLCKYEVTYDDGSAAEIIVHNQNDCNEWNTWSLGGWQPVYKSLRLYIMAWKNPHPEKKIKSIEMKDGELYDMAFLLAVTAGV